jgi:hypothetical protein
MTSAVTDAGIVLAAMLAHRMGIEALVDETVDLGEPVGAANAGATVMTPVSAMALGADCIDDLRRVAQRPGPVRCSAIRSRHRRRLARSSEPSRSGTSASSTAS